jgi:hypothetical protein
MTTNGAGWRVWTSVGQFFNKFVKNLQFWVFSILEIKEPLVLVFWNFIESQNLWFQFFNISESKDPLILGFEIFHSSGFHERTGKELVV